MTPERYKRIAELFLASYDLEETERATLLDRECGTDADLRREVDALFRFYVPEKPEERAEKPEKPASRAPAEGEGEGEEARASGGPPTPTTRGATRIPRRKRYRAPLRVLAAAVAAAAVLVGARWWAVGAVEPALREARTEALGAVLDQRVTALREWAERQKARVQAALGDPELARHIRELVRVAETSASLRDDLPESPSHRVVVERMTAVPEDLRRRGFGAGSPRGVMIAADEDRLIGSEIAPVGGALLRRGLLGEWLVVKPFRDRQYLVGESPELPDPVMAVGGPIRDESGAIVGIVVFRFDADEALARFFAPPPPGPPAEIFAFDEKGVLLTEPGDPGRLRALGRLPKDPGTRAALRLAVRDPGGDLAAGFRPDLPRERWPMTRMGQAAVSGKPGADSEGYRSYRGREVLGAWTWLPEWEMGVAVEADLAEATAAAGPVRGSFGVLLAVLAATAGGLFFASLRRERLRRDREAAAAFGAYVLERRIGRGGMAEVHLARHALLKRPTAVKILDANAVDPVAVARFEREATLLSRLTHPNTIQLFDYGFTPDGRFYYAMEYLEGLNLAQLVSLEGPLPPARAIHLLRQVCGSLEEAHAAGLVHRDVKPANIMVCRRGGVADVVKVLDFGIARSLTDATVELTGPFQLSGTPLYIAPERIRSPQTADRRSDIYALGAVAFQMLAARNVFEGPGPTEILYQTMTAEPPSPSRLRGGPVPAELERLVLACLAKDPEARPASAAAVDEALRSVEIPDRWGQEEARAWWAANEERVARLTAAASA